MAKGKIVQRRHTGGAKVKLTKQGTPSKGSKGSFGASSGGKGSSGK